MLVFSTFPFQLQALKIHACLRDKVAYNLRENVVVFPVVADVSFVPLTDEVVCAPYMIRLRFYNKLECMFEFFPVPCMGSWASPFDLYHLAVEAFVVRKCNDFSRIENDIKPVYVVIPYEVCYGATG
jgi:hypothetical protein